MKKIEKEISYNNLTKLNYNTMCNRSTLYDGTDFRFSARSRTAAVRRRRRRRECWALRTHRPSSRRRTGTTCCPPCRPADHPSRPGTSPSRPHRSPHTACCPSASCRPPGKPGQKWSAEPPDVGLCRLPSLYVCKHHHTVDLHDNGIPNALCVFFAKSAYILIRFILWTHFVCFPGWT